LLRWLPAGEHVSNSTAICFLAFWIIQPRCHSQGIEYIRFLQGISAPILLAVGLLLLGWAYQSAALRPDAVGPFTIHELADFLKFLVRL